jgi:hypothetical protein
MALKKLNFQPISISPEKEACFFLIGVRADMVGILRKRRKIGQK